MSEALFVGCIERLAVPAVEQLGHRENPPINCCNSNQDLAECESSRNRARSRAC